MDWTSIYFDPTAAGTRKLSFPAAGSCEILQLCLGKEECLFFVLSLSIPTEKRMDSS
jgi:hypothetical protein